ncbi:phosphoribosylformylglycinamidine synthase subunit PurS [candidate division TA06 bacterium]|nr:phosphoribosylformylglycinamidine synthase subunit PurS [candidate division TA06 bacterium]
MTAEIRVTLRDGVLDPQGTTLNRSLENIGYKGLKDVRMGKLIQLTLDLNDRAQAQKLVEELCQKVLTNPVIEQYQFTIGESK